MRNRPRLPGRASLLGALGLRRAFVPARPFLRGVLTSLHLRRRTPLPHRRRRLRRLLLLYLLLALSIQALLFDLRRGALLHRLSRLHAWPGRIAL